MSGRAVTITLGNPGFTSSVPRPVVRAGTLPAALFDQEERWIDPNGFEHRIVDLDADTIYFVLDYLLANAKRLRERWADETGGEFDGEQRARQWMLARPAVLALMRQLVRVKDVTKDSDATA